MATFFKSSRLWVLEFTYDGRARRWIRPLPEGEDGPAVLRAQIADLYGKHGRVTLVRPATTDEETQYIEGTVPVNILCPTGRRGTP